MAQGKWIFVLGLGLAGLAVYALTRKAKASEAIQLAAGWNEVTYTGARKKAGIALQSIAGYLEIAYYYDALAGQWKQVVYDTLLEPEMELSIKVSQDCVWKI